MLVSGILFGKSGFLQNLIFEAFFAIWKSRFESATFELKHI
jgi:hypothetical protein